MMHASFKAIKVYTVSVYTYPKTYFLSYYYGVAFCSFIACHVHGFAVYAIILSKCMHVCMYVGTTTLKMTHSPSATAHLPTLRRTVSRLVQISTQPMEATRLVPWGTVDMEASTAKLVND